MEVCSLKQSQLKYSLENVHVPPVVCASQYLTWHSLHHYTFVFHQERLDMCMFSIQNQRQSGSIWQNGYILLPNSPPKRKWIIEQMVIFQMIHLFLLYLKVEITASHAQEEPIRGKRSRITMNDLYRLRCILEQGVSISTVRQTLKQIRVPFARK